VSCPEGFGTLRDPAYFETFGRWQNRYGRDNLRLSGHFLSIFLQYVDPILEEALDACPSYVLEIMMNAVLEVETKQGLNAAKSWISQIFRLRDRALLQAEGETLRKLQILMDEWSVDIAAVYPKFLHLKRLGPSPALSEASTPDEHCLGQRFFLYKLDDFFYQPGTLSCLQGQWGTEVVMHHYLQHNCRTEDPEEANWFYVPMYTTCRYVHLNNTMPEVEDLMSMDAVSDAHIWNPLVETLRSSKYYQRRQGQDHIFLFADGQGPRVWHSYDIFRSESIFLSPESKCPTWGEPVRRYLDVKPCLSSWKDIIIPGHTDFARIQYMQKHNKASQERQLLATFHGRTPGAHEAYADCAVRAALLRLGQRGPHVDVGGFVEDYPERKGDAHFCFVPAGTSPWTNHLYESFYAGCIPVILSDEYEVAFAEELDWPSFSIKWPEAEVGEGLYQYLEGLATYLPHRVFAMKVALERHACWFNWYSTDPTCSPYLLIHRKLARLASLRRSRSRFWNVDEEYFGATNSHEPPLAFAHLRRPTRFKHFEGEDSNFTYLSSENL